MSLKVWRQCKKMWVLIVSSRHILNVMMTPRTGREDTFKEKKMTHGLKWRYREKRDERKRFALLEMGSRVISGWTSLTLISGYSSNKNTPSVCLMRIQINSTWHGLILGNTREEQTPGNKTPSDTGTLAALLLFYDLLWSHFLYFVSSYLQTTRLVQELKRQLTFPMNWQCNNLHHNFTKPNSNPNPTPNPNPNAGGGTATHHSL